MDQIINNIQASTVPAYELADWALSHGVSSLTTEEVSWLCGIPAGHVSQRMASLRKRSKIFSPARGLWIPIPPENRTWGAPSPLLYIDDMMAHLGTEYLVGWLSAAERHGASHHAAQVFQVATNRPVRDRQFGRSRLEFFTRSYVRKATFAPDKTRTAGARIASVGTTMLMLAADISACGGMDNVANLIIELAEENRGFSESLLADASLFPDSAVRRIGWLLDNFGNGAPDGLSEYCSSLSSEASFLSPSSPRAGKLATEWKIIINEEVDPDI